LAISIQPRGDIVVNPTVDIGLMSATTTTFPQKIQFPLKSNFVFKSNPYELMTGIRWWLLEIGHERSTRWSKIWVPSGQDYQNPMVMVMKWSA